MIRSEAVGVASVGGAASVTVATGAVVVVGTVGETTDAVLVVAVTRPEVVAAGASTDAVAAPAVSFCFLRLDRVSNTQDGGCDQSSSEDVFHSWFFGLFVWLRGPPPLYS